MSIRVTPQPKAVLLDLDGTVFWKGALIPGAKEAIAALRDLGLALRFLTNTDSQTREGMRDRLMDMGLQVSAEEIFTPLAALERLLQRNPGSCLFLLHPKLEAPFAHFRAEGKPRYVIVGDPSYGVDYAQLNAAFRALRAGAQLVVLQPSRLCVRADGEYLDTGAFAHLLEFATGQTAIVLGKPAKEFFHLALHDLNLEPSAVIVVGDDVNTDMAGAAAIGARSILVKTGKFTATALETTTHAPDYLLEQLADLPKMIGRAISHQEKL